MTDELDKTTDEVTLKMKIEDILEAVTKSGNKAMITETRAHAEAGEDLKKAWFRHMLSSMEKLSDLVETVRSVDINNLKVDLKEEIRKVEVRIDKLEQQIKENRNELLSKVDKIDTKLAEKIERSHKDLLVKIDALNRDLQAYKTTVDGKFTIAEKELQSYKKDVVDPLKLKILTISVKLGVWATIAGIVGSGIGAALLYLAKVYIFKTP